MFIQNLLYNSWVIVALGLAILDTIGIIGSLTSIVGIFIHLLLVIKKLPNLINKNNIAMAGFSNILFRYSIVIFIVNVLIFTWSFAFGVFFISFLAKLLYIEFPKAQERIKAQNEFKQQFGDINTDTKIDEETILKKHIENLFEENIPFETIDNSMLKKQFRKMAKIYHPDTNAGEHNDRFHSIKLSYDFLKSKIAK